MFEGVIIKETLTDELFLDYLTIDKTEIWKTDDSAIKYWTMVFFRSDSENLPGMLAKVIIEGWFADMKEGNRKYIVFKDKVLSYEIGNSAEKAAVVDYCRLRGIPAEQCNWDE